MKAGRCGDCKGFQNLNTIPNLPRGLSSRSSSSLHFNVVKNEFIFWNGKRIEYPLESEACHMLEPDSQEMIIPDDDDDGDYTQVFANVLLDAKNLDRTDNKSPPGLEVEHHPCSTLPSLDEAPGSMVEELTLRSYNGGADVALVGPSNNRDRMQPTQNQWQHLYQLAGGSGSGTLLRDSLYMENAQATADVDVDADAWGDVGHSSSPRLLPQEPPTHINNEIMEQMTTAENKDSSGNSFSPGGIRTKILSKSGFSEYFVKNTLKGKGVNCRGPPRDVAGFDRAQTNAKPTNVSQQAADALLSPSLKTAVPRPNVIAESEPAPGPGSSNDGFSLREWLKAGRSKVKKIERLYIFRQIVNLVDSCHSQGVALQGLWPSCFKLLPSNQVTYLGPCTQRELRKSNMDQNISVLENQQIGKRPLEQGVSPSVSLSAKKHKFCQNSNLSRQWPQFPLRSSFKYATPNAIGISISDHQDSGYGFNSLNTEHTAHRRISSAPVFTSSQHRSTLVSERLEEKWYTIPEELGELGCTFSTNIYSLGVLLFELLGSFDSDKAHAAAMLDLRHRILPPNFLSENPKEAGFCLWLLHPEPSSRPMTREILQSEVINGLGELCGEESSASIEQEDVEAELLLHFLVSTNEQKEIHASKLMEDIKCLEADIKEIEKRHPSKNSSIFSSSNNDFYNATENQIPHRNPLSSEVLSQSSPISYTNDVRLIKNIGQLESAYFSMRSKVQLPENDATTRSDKDLLNNREHPTQNDEGKKPTDRVGAFFDGLCKYARYSKFEVRGVLRNGEFINSANVICSLSFDRDADYFATAGVSKKIKIFEFQSLFNDSVDIHYPVIEMSNRSKLTCVGWNPYIKNYMASTDYDGVVKLWDVNTGQGFSQYIEHQKRAWSVDFSQVDPTKLASGSDDCSVKLWSINEKNCLGTIRKIANVCCVQFSAHSANLLAFGSADSKIYCYDLRNARSPWCTLAGHEKAVSFVKFVDSETLVSASTDNTLKLWDLNKTSSNGLSTNACSLTLNGHSNEKNFVGLSVADGYIACGSETNEVYAYRKSLPMPITSHKFGSIDPISGKETDDDNGHFVSSICWRGKSDMVLAANSTGCIKVLQMV